MKGDFRFRLSVCLNIVLATVLAVILFTSSFYVPQKAEAAAPSKTIVFLGDSLTAKCDWNALFGVKNIVNMGVLGDKTRDVMGRLDAAINLKPEKLFLLAGINDIWFSSVPEDTMAIYKEILRRIRTETPKTKVYVQSVLPCNLDVWKIIPRPTTAPEQIIALNAEIRKIAVKYGCEYIDLHSSFVGSGGYMKSEYTVDGIHLSQAGYAIWKNAILDKVTK